MTKDRRLLRRLTTEKQNPASLQLDGKSPLEIARLINAEDAKVAKAVKKALSQIARAIEWITEGIAQGGRLIYVGTGTSGRIAALDAAEIPPTFSASPRLVQFVMAGGARALGKAVEANEDSRRMGEHDLARKTPGKNDVVVGIAASGRTPYTVAALAYARRHGAKTIAVTCNRDSPLQKAADLAIVTEVGPEVVAGSTRMKAASAQKMVLNILSTGAMTRLGYVHSNLMVNLRPKNSKLRERGIAIIQRLTAVPRNKAENTLEKAGTVAAAVIMLKSRVSRKEAEKLLAQAHGRLRIALTNVQ